MEPILWLLVVLGLIQALPHPLFVLLAALACVALRLLMAVTASDDKKVDELISLQRAHADQLIELANLRSELATIRGSGLSTHGTAKNPMAVTASDDKKVDELISLQRAHADQLIELANLRSELATIRG